MQQGLQSHGSASLSFHPHPHPILLQGHEVCHRDAHQSLWGSGSCYQRFCCSQQHRGQSNHAFISCHVLPHRLASKSIHCGHCEQEVSSFRASHAFQLVDSHIITSGTLCPTGGSFRPRENSNKSPALSLEHSAVREHCLRFSRQCKESTNKALLKGDDALPVRLSSSERMPIAVTVD